MSIARFARCAGLPAAAALLLGAAPAHAVDAVTPAPCNGIHQEDSSGDTELQPPGGFGLPFPPAGEGPPATDLTALFFNYRAGKDGKKVLTANVQVANLVKDVPSPPDSSGGIAWYVIYTYDGSVRFLRAHNMTGDEVTYAYGTIDPELGTYTTDGETTGAFFEGANGVVQMDVPEEVGGKLGEELGGAIATADVFSAGPDDQSGINNHVDTAPDDASVVTPNGQPYTVAECPSEAPAAPPAAVPASPPPLSSPSAAPAPAPSQSSSGEARVTFSKVIGSARKAKKGRTLRVKVRSSQEIKRLRVQLRDRKGRLVASGAMKRLDGLGTLRLKVRRALKAGRYTVRASANVGGSTKRFRQTVFARR
jgi:hypothetical protein